MNNLSHNSISRFKELVHDASKVVVVSHTHPDGDALGCASAMFHYLDSTLKKDAVFLVEKEISATLEFILKGVKKTDDVDVLESCDLVIAVDFNCLSRTAPGFEDAIQKCRATKILIDHHLNPCLEEFDLVFSEIQVSSASELLFWILRKVQGDSLKGLSKPALTALMCGMTTDTNNFANSVWPTTLDMASQLLAAGVDRDDIIRRIFNSYRSARVRAFGFLLDKSLAIRDGYSYIIISREFKKKFGIREGELEGLVNVPLSIGKIKISITLTEDDGFYRVSLRSKRGVKVNTLASEYFHGGGHAQASGGRLYIGSDIPSREDLPSYVEECTARFLHSEKNRV